MIKAEINERQKNNRKKSMKLKAVSVIRSINWINL